MPRYPVWSLAFAWRLSASAFWTLHPLATAVRTRLLASSSARRPSEAPPVAPPALPDELVLIIMQSLDARGLATASKVCVLWRQLERQHEAELWERLLPTDMAASPEFMNTWPSPAKRLCLLMSREQQRGVDPAPALERGVGRRALLP